MQNVDKHPVAHRKPRMIAPTSTNQSKYSGLLKEILKNRYLYLLAMPGLLFFLIFKYIPMFGIVIAFQNYSPFKGITGSPWVGFDHFQRFFSNPDFLMIFRNTMGINLLNLVLFFPLPILISVFLNELRSDSSQSCRFRALKGQRPMSI